MTSTSFKGDFMEAIKEAYGEATMHKVMEVIGEDGMLREKTSKAELPKFFIHSGKAIDIPSGWNIVETGKILKGDRAYAGSAETGKFINEASTLSLIGGSVKDRICIIRKMTKEEIDEYIKETIEEIATRMDKDEFLKAIKIFLGE